MSASDSRILHPDHLAPGFQVGLELFRAGRFQEALATYDRLLATHPDHPQLLSSRGAALGALRRFEQALESFELALARQPDFMPALNGKVTTLRALNRSPPASRRSRCIPTTRGCSASAARCSWARAACRTRCGASSAR
jgi:tetratricopeptide (TPR) repeat protein